MSFLKTYLKAVLYAYPLLQTVEKDYADHITNKALLSYESKKSTEELAEYLAEEILRKERLIWLKKTVRQVYERLNEEEKTLVSVRYFGKKRKGARDQQEIGEKSKEKAMSERMYFRRVKRAEEKMGAMLLSAGLDGETYEKNFAKIEPFQKIHTFLEKNEKQKSG